MAAASIRSATDAPEPLVVKYSYIRTPQWNLYPTITSGNNDTLQLFTPATGSRIKFSTAGGVHVFNTGIKIISLPPGYRLRLQSSHSIKEAPFFIIGCSFTTCDEIIVKVLATRPYDLEYNRLVGECVLESNPIFIHQNLPSSSVPSSVSSVTYSDSESD